MGALVSIATAKPQLSADSQLSTDGTVDLHWQGETARYELQQASDASFSDAHVRYEGSDRESVITGLRDGHYHFRVREISPDQSAGPWSEGLELEVKSMARGPLFLLLGTGAFVATLTIAAILHGFVRNR